MHLRVSGGSHGSQWVPFQPCREQRLQETKDFLRLTVMFYVKHLSTTLPWWSLFLCIGFCRGLGQWYCLILDNLYQLFWNHTPAKDHPNRTIFFSAHALVPGSDMVSKSFYWLWRWFVGRKATAFPRETLLTLLATTYWANPGWSI